MSDIGFLHIYLGIRLRDLRERAGYSLAEVERRAKYIGSRRTIGRLENAQIYEVYMPTVDHLAQFYRADDGLREELKRMALSCTDSSVDVWMEPIGLPTRFGLLTELERKATRIRVYETEFVTGLLQTRETAAAILDTNVRLSEEDKLRYGRARQNRKEAVLSTGEPASVELVLAEGVLQRAIGGEETRRAQVRYLKELDERPNVSIRYIPHAAGAAPSSGHSFMLLDLPANYAGPVLYSESAVASTYTGQTAAVEARTEAHMEMQAMALPIGEFQV
ncbi:helix-turn-helix transcriptional regulator [Phytomonospora sp. NPDC050363]|uniref:helix-turn-helix domain-containing protein n=1 Tax=Phytomonospora sp. NPDC050363 TaxID=3155642 RepID=UPI0033F336E6